MKRNPAAQRDLHVVSEALALTVVAPMLTYVAMTNPAVPRWQRGFLYLVAAGSVLVDGYLLAKWFDASSMGPRTRP